MTDLWPDDFGHANVTPPLLILKEQGQLLSQKTRGLVEGFVTTDGRSHDFHLTFYLRAPSLDNYTYNLLEIDHPLELYPLRISSDLLQDTLAEVDTEEQFVGVLRRILSSEQTKRIVNAIIAQAQAVTA